MFPFSFKACLSQSFCLLELKTPPRPFRAPTQGPAVPEPYNQGHQGPNTQGPCPDLALTFTGRKPQSRGSRGSALATRRQILHGCLPKPHALDLKCDS